MGCSDPSQCVVNVKFFMSNPLSPEEKQAKKLEFFERLNRPPALVASIVLTLFAAVMGWITQEMAFLCSSVGILGIFLHFQKTKGRDKTKP
jgi:hypothetical protein